jgi:hypothetical protein
VKTKELLSTTIDDAGWPIDEADSCSRAVRTSEVGADICTFSGTLFDDTAATEEAREVRLVTTKEDDCSTLLDTINCGVEATEEAAALVEDVDSMIKVVGICELEVTLVPVEVVDSAVEEVEAVLLVIAEPDETISTVGADV